MQFYDIDSDSKLNLIDLFRQWQEFKQIDSFNHSESFIIEMFEIIMATINGRNNLEIIGFTGNEISNIVIKLKGKIDNDSTGYNHKISD